MREDILRALEAEYAETRRQNELTEQRRKVEILSGDPELARLVREREQMIYGTLRSILSGGGEADRLPEKMEQASAGIRKRLRENGYPEDYLAPVYRCALCRDTGYTGEPVKTPCACLEKAYRARLRERIGLEAGQRESFETFRLDLFPDKPLPGSTLSQRKLMEHVRKICETWAESWPQSRQRDLLLMGKSGLGKTFLLHAMAERLIEREKNVLLVSAFQFLQMARKSYYENDQGMSDLLEAEVLMLDDVGSEPLMQNVTIEQLFHLINERQTHGRATVISTNLDRNEFKARYTERIASRMMDVRSSAVILLEGEDIRRQGRKQAE